MLIAGIINCILGAICACAAGVLTKRNPNLIANGFILELALLFFLNSMYFFIWNPADPSPAAFLFLSVIIYGIWILYGVLGICLLLNGVLTVRREGVSLTHALPFVWGFLLLFVSYWLIFGPENNFQGFELIGQLISLFTMFVAYIPFALFGVWLSNEICYRSKTPPEKDYIVVLGCGLCSDGTPTPLLKARLNAAHAAYIQGECAAHFIVSGGRGSDEVISEAASMKNYLLTLGVPEACIIKEEASTTTQENLRNSKEIMLSRSAESTSNASNSHAPHCTIATSNYHCLRAALYARKLGMNVCCVGGRTAPFYFPAAFFREYIALIMNNRYAIALFLLITIVRFALVVTNILPSGIF